MLTQTHIKLSYHIGHTVIDHSVRNFALNLLGKCLCDLVCDVVFAVCLQLLGKLFSYLFSVLLNSFGLTRYVLNELIVKLGQDPRLYLMNSNLELSRLSCK